MIQKIFSSLVVIAMLSSASFALSKVDLNQASQKELEALPGVGATTAKRIIEARPLKSIDDLKTVKGMSKKDFEKLQDLVVVSGSAAAPAAVVADAPKVEAPKKIEAPATTQAMTPQNPQANDSRMSKRAASKLAAGEMISLNSGSQDQIEKLPGIGPKKAEAIIANRPYKSLEDVMKVKGIKQGLFNKIKDNISL